MPKTSNYANCKFYRLVCKDPAVKECYVGHTCDEVKRRYSHKTRCTNAKNKKYNLLVYKFLREHGSWDNWSLIVHETLAVENKTAAVLRERYWFEFYKATLNSNVPGRTDAEYRAVHVEEIKTYNAEYHKAHAEEIKTYNAAYHKAHAEEIKTYHAAYHKAHVDEIKTYNAEYHKAHADKINAHKAEKHDCECGGKFTNAHHNRHLRTARHCTYLAAQAAL